MTAAVRTFALVQYFADGANGGSVGDYVSTLVPMERVPARAAEVMTALNGTLISEGDEADLSKELDAFLETCKDCETSGAVRLPAGAAVTVLCQLF